MDDIMYTSEQATAARVKELALGIAVSGMMAAAARLRIADAIDGEPTPVKQIAETVRADPATLERLLRAMAAHGVFVDAGDGCYGHSDLSWLLREDHPRSVLYQVLWTVAPWAWQAWPHLDRAVVTGEPVVPELFGKDFFGYLSDDEPESAAVFNRAMTQSSQYTSEAVADALDLRDAQVVADIGGGQGHLLRVLLERHPHLRGVLMDLPAATANADPSLRAGGALSDRTVIISTSCLDSVPVEADVYILKNLLEWSDDKTVRTLRNVTQAAPPGARVTLVQNLIDDSPEIKVTTAMDMLLLLNVGGRKHTRQHLIGLVERGGLRLTDIRPTRSALFVLEAVVPY